MTFGDTIKQQRIRLGLTQGELAAGAGFSQNAISQYENGKRQVDFESYTAIMGYMGAKTRIEGPTSGAARYRHHANLYYKAEGSRVKIVAFDPMSPADAVIDYLPMPTERDAEMYCYAIAVINDQIEASYEKPFSIVFDHLKRALFITLYDKEDSDRERLEGIVQPLIDLRLVRTLKVQ